MRIVVCRNVTKSMGSSTPRTNALVIVALEDTLNFNDACNSFHSAFNHRRSAALFSEEHSSTFVDQLTTWYHPGDLLEELKVDQVQLSKLLKISRLKSSEIFKEKWTQTVFGVGQGHMSLCETSKVTEIIKKLTEIIKKLGLEQSGNDGRTNMVSHKDDEIPLEQKRRGDLHLFTRSISDDQTCRLKAKATKEAKVEAAAAVKARTGAAKQIGEHELTSQIEEENSKLR